MAAAFVAAAVAIFLLITLLLKLESFSPIPLD
jgi:hypothetical protein